MILGRQTMIMGTNSNSNTPIAALAAEYNFMKDNTLEKGIARNVLQNISKIPSLTLEQVAQLCNVSIPTFSRFCKSIGYPSYSVFKIKIGEALGSYGYKNAPFPSNVSYSGETYISMICDRLTADIRSFVSAIDTSVCEKLVEALNRAKKVFIHDALYSTIRLSLQSDLAVTGKKVFFSPNQEQQKQDISEADDTSLFLFVYDLNPRSQQILKSIPMVREKGAKAAVITPVKVFPGSKFCNYIVEIGLAQAGISELMLRDVTFQYLSVLYRERYI